MRYNWDVFAQTTTHKTLLDRVASGQDPTAWRDFCDRYEELIRRFALRRGVTGAEADDVLQDVLLALTKAMPRFEYDPAKGKFRSYLKTVVLRTIFKKSHEKRGAIDLSLIDETTRAAAVDVDLDDQWEAEWRQHHLRQAMRVIELEFNATDWKAFQAYVVDGEEAGDVGAKLQLTAAQVYQAKYRVMTRLREVIAMQVANEG